MKSYLHNCNNFNISFNTRVGVIFRFIKILHRGKWQYLALYGITYEILQHFTVNK